MSIESQNRTINRMKPYAENRKAMHDYEILEKFEGGLVLDGNEVKSIREGGAKLLGAYLQLFQGELWLIGAHVSAYSKQGKTDGYDPTRRRKVLVHTKELNQLFGKTQQKGLTLVPFSLYPSGRRIKLSFALCRGKKAFDKREKLKERDLTRQTARFLRGQDE
ncbi:MAG TPA: SsrA-binding protein SmpB [Patescibacteria group bacterium]|nr:SsrA-binding protein SmpB [Patescibacteria group bacterium]